MPRRLTNDQTARPTSMFTTLHGPCQYQQPPQMQPVPETPYGGWNGSELFRPIDPDDFSGSRRGYFGDVPVASALHRIGSLFIDMMLCVFCQTSLPKSLACPTAPCCGSPSSSSLPTPLFTLTHAARRSARRSLVSKVFAE
jgi:hypothetical protein